MSSSCSGLMSNYVKCLRDSDCIKVQRQTIKQCSEQKVDECEGLRYALYQCRRASLDPRTRIQGNKGY